MAKSRSGTAIENNRKLRPWKPKPQTLNKTPPSSHVFSPSSSVKSVASHRSPQSPANSQRHIPFDNIAASAHFDTYFNQSRSIPYSKRFNRIPIGEIKVGKAYTGTVRNLIEHFGFFVDIGSVVDGLVHIGDISPMFFTRAVQNRVKRGQKITVWVKDVDPIRNRIRLRMYPINSAIKYRWSGLKVGQEVNGTVSKIADDALYVDIGAPMLGYLPRRNMKIPKGKGNYLVHEIAPYNSTVRCFIREVNDKLRRLTVTTYLPENWHIYLPPLPTEEVIKSEARPYKGRFAEQEELKRQKQLEREAFKRRMRGETAGPNQYETDDDVDDDQMSDNDGFSTAESLSDEEIEQLSNQRPVLFDDLRGDSVPIKLTRGQRQRIQAAADGGDRQLTTKQLFKMLCDGKDYITFKDFKHWWYVQVLKQAGDWDGRKFKEVMAEASGGYLRVYESQLDRFLIIFARKFGIKTGRDDEVPDEKDAEGFEGDVKQTEIDEVNLKTAHPDVEEDARALLQEEGLGHRKDEYDFSISDIDSIGGLTEADAKWMLCEEMRVDKSAEVNLDEFKSMLSTPRSRTLKWDQVKEWKLSRLVLAAKIVTAAELKDIFHAGNNDRISMNEIQFQQYVHTLRCVLQDRLFSSLQEAPTDVVQFKSILPVSPPVQSNIQVSTDNLTAIIERMDQDLAHSKQHDGALESNIIEDGTGESIEYDQLMSKLFAKLSKGKSFILFEDLLQWEMVQDLMEMGKVDTDYLKEMVKLLNQVENQNDEEENIESAIFSSSRLEIDIEKFKTIVTMLGNMLGDFGQSEIEGRDTINPPESSGDDGANSIDVDSIFDELAKGRKEVGLDDLLLVDWFSQYDLSREAIKEEWSEIPNRSLNRDEFAFFFINMLEKNGFDVE